MRNVAKPETAVKQAGPGCQKAKGDTSTTLRLHVRDEERPGSLPLIVRYGARSRYRGNISHYIARSRVDRINPVC